MGWMIIQKHHRFTMAHTEIVDSFDTIYINIPWITIVSPWMIIQYHTYTMVFTIVVDSFQILCTVVSCFLLTQ